MRRDPHAETSQASQCPVEWSSVIPVEPTTPASEPRHPPHDGMAHHDPHAHPDDVGPLSQGWITPLVRWILHAVTWPSRLVLGPPHVRHDLPEDRHEQWAAHRKLVVDTYLAICMTASIACLVGVASFAQSAGFWPLLVYPGWRIVDSIAAVVRVALFDDSPRPRRRMIRRDATRVIVLGTMNYCELVISFASFYAYFPQFVHHNPAIALPVASSTLERVIGALHMSAVTQFTIGYGDLAPIGPLRPLTWLQGAAGVLIIGLLVARYLAKPSEIATVERKSEKSGG